jgi:glycosyltransferase involved in cell wall biosynthesis
MKISILIPTLEERRESLILLRAKIVLQVRAIFGSYHDSPVTMFCEVDKGEMSIGSKRNSLLQKAESDYICFIDDDDDISDNYIEWLLKAAESGCDCASLKGCITFDGINPELFEHSIKYPEWRTNDHAYPMTDVKYERGINHLNLVKTSIAKQFLFPEINHGEDKAWSDQLRDSGLLKTEFEIPEVIYYYKYITKK